jgi:hypothetical protein
MVRFNVGNLCVMRNFGLGSTVDSTVSVYCSGVELEAFQKEGGKKYEEGLDKVGRTCLSRYLTTEYCT